MDLIKIGKFISSKRKEKNITQSELAEKLSISDRAISKWEKGETVPNAYQLVALCHALNVSPSRLLGIRISDRELTDKENDIIDAYRQKPEMQHAVDVLLGLAEDK